MKAVICPKYGPPDVLKLVELEKPTPKENEILIRVHATTVTAGDVRIRGFDIPSIAWLPVRLMFGFTKPRNPILGHEFSGEVEAVGSAVTRFKEGDRVFASMGFKSGSYAEYVCLPEVVKDGALALMPNNMSFEQAAAIPVGGLTALHFLRKGKIESRQRVLVNGASGSVGSFGVQIAKHFGAEVTGVASGSNSELVKSLGADHFVDYTQGDFTEDGNKYDLIFDAVGKLSPAQSKRALAENGSFVSVARGMVKETTEELGFLRELTENDKIRPAIDKTYPLEQIVEAHQYVDTGRKKGNVVIVL